MYNYLDPSFIFASTRFPIFHASKRPSTIGHARAVCIGHPWQVKLFTKMLLSIAVPGGIVVGALTLLVFRRPLQQLALRATAALRSGYEPVKSDRATRAPST
jgi:hypothetical protein